MEKSSVVIDGFAIALTVGTVVAMEFVAWFTHKYVMHGFGWRWHRDHHVPSEGRLEKNDLFAVCGALLAIVLFALGSPWIMGAGALPWATPVAIGVTIYGVLYFITHDALVHQRWGFRYIPREGYLKRLVQAHKLHHSTLSKDGAVSFGFLWAADPHELRSELAKHRRDGGAVRVRRQRRTS